MPRKRRKKKYENLMDERSLRLYEETLEKLETDPLQKYSELEAYMSPFRRYPALTDFDDFLRLYKGYKNGSIGARDLIVYGNIRLILSVALKYVGRGLPLLDMMQEGVFGLLTALDKFDPEIGCKFSTYAVWWIKQSISRAIANLGGKRPFRIPVHKQEKLNRVVKVIEIFFKKNCRLPDDAELLDEVLRIEAEKAAARAAEFLLNGEESKEEDEEIVNNVTTIDDIKECRRIINQGYISLQDKVIDSEDMLVEELVKDQGADTETSTAASQLLIEYEKAMGRIETEIDALDNRAAMVIRLRFGLNELPSMTLEEIGERFGVTRERIRQIEAKALSMIFEKIGVSGEQIEQIANAIDELKQIALLQ